MSTPVPDIALAVAYVESAALNLMRVPCPYLDPPGCPRCLAGAQLAKALKCLDVGEGGAAA